VSGVSGLEAASTVFLTMSGTLVVLLVVSVVGLRVWRWLADAASRRRSEWARGFLLRVLDGEDPRPPVGRGRRRAVAEGAARLSGKVTGADHVALAEWLTGSGYRQRAVQMMASPFALSRTRGARLFAACLVDRETRPLLDLLHDRDVRVRMTAARALGECRLDTAVPYLVRAAGSPDRPLPLSVAAVAIIRTRPRTARGLGMAWSSPEPAVAAMAADVAGHLNLADARGALEQAVGSDSAHLAAASARALARLGDPRSAAPVAARLARGDLLRVDADVLEAALVELGGEVSAP